MRWQRPNSALPTSKRSWPRSGYPCANGCRICSMRFGYGLNGAMLMMPGEIQAGSKKTVVGQWGAQRTSPSPTGSRFPHHPRWSGRRSMTRLTAILLLIATASWGQTYPGRNLGNPYTYGDKEAVKLKCDKYQHFEPEQLGCGSNGY